jgi:capsular exopolysaccharide synthesis family protein
MSVIDRQSATDVEQNRPPDGHHGVDIGAILTLLYRRKLIIITTVVLLTGLTMHVSSQLTPLYTASSAVMIEPRTARIVDLKEVVEELPRDQSMIDTQINLLRSTTFAQSAIEDLGLLSDPEFNVALHEEGAAPPGGANHSVPLADRLLSLWASAVEALPQPWALATGLADQTDEDKAVALAVDTLIEEAQQQRSEAEADEQASGRNERVMDLAFEIFQDSLDVIQSGDSYAITIGFTSTDPDKSARIANRLAELYVEDQIAAKRAATVRAAESLGERIAELRAQLMESERAAESYRAANELVGAAGGLGLTDQELSTLQRDLIVARAEQDEKGAKLRLIRELWSRGESLESVAEVMASPVITSLRLEEARLQREAAQLSQELGPRHPRILQLEADKTNLAARIGAEIRNIARNLENEIVVARTRERTIQEQLDRVRAESSAHNQAQVQLRILQRDVESTRDLYTAFLNRFKELNEQQDLIEPGVRIVSTALVPRTPSFPRPKLMVIVGFTSSLIIGTMLAFLADRLDSGLRRARHVEQTLDVPNLAFIPKAGRIKLRQHLHHYVVDKPQSAYAESVRTVLSALRFANIDEPPRVVLVTSSLPEEGKTTLAMSLAATAARDGYKTVLVDLDLRRPGVARRLQGSRNPDLVDFLVGRQGLDDILHADDRVEDLRIIPVRRVINPTELIASQRMALLIRELRERYRYVILDSPPLLGFADTRFAALLADIVVFAVRWGKTAEQPARNAMRILRDSRAKVAGTVITQVNIRQHKKFEASDVIYYYGKYGKYYVD